MTRKVGMMDMPLFRRIVDESALWGSELRLFNFGEPLLHPGFTDMIRYAGSKRLQVNFQTNGLLLDRQRTTELLDAGVGYIGVSVNGLTAAEYAGIRPGHDLETVKQNVRGMYELAREKSAALYIHINAQITAEERNLRSNDIRAFIAYWEGIPDSLSVSGISMYDRIDVFSQGRMSRVDQQGLARRNLDQVKCNEPFDRIVIKWDGRVTPCCADYDARLVVGRAGDDSLHDIWHGPALNRLREIVAGRRFQECDLCASCPKMYSTDFTLLFKKPSKGAVAREGAQV